MHSSKSKDSQEQEPSLAAQFERDSQQDSPGILREFWDFLCAEKKWWLTPIIIVLLFVGLLILLSGTVAAPFIYLLF